MKREELKKEKEEKLLKISYILFLKNGFDNTSIQDITDSANIGKGTFYSYFKDKDEIRDVLITKTAQKMFSEAIDKLHKKPEIKYISDKTIFVVNELIDDLTKDKRLVKFISKDLPYALYIGTVNKLFIENEPTTLDLFSNNVKYNNERLKNPKITLSLLVDLVGSSIYNSIMHNKPLPINEFKEPLFNAIKAIIEDENS